MSDRRQRGEPPYLELAPEPGVAGGAPVTGQIQRYVRSTEGVLKALRQELDYYQAHNSELVRERNEQLRLLSRVERDRASRSELDEELRVLRRERDRTTDELGPLQQENRELRARCAVLEAEVEKLRHRQAEAQEIISYFEIQFEEVERIMQLLSEHRSFMLGPGADGETEG